MVKVESIVLCRIRSREGKVHGLQGSQYPLAVGDKVHEMGRISRFVKVESMASKGPHYPPAVKIECMDGRIRDS
jgi:hypothetical protein